MQRQRTAFSWTRMLVTNSVIALASPVIFLLLSRQPFTLKSAGINFLYGLLYAHCIGTLATLLIPYAYIWTMKRHAAIRWLLVAVALLLATLAGCAIGSGILVAIGITSPSSFWRQFEWSVRTGVIITFACGGMAVMYEVLRNRLERTTLELRTIELERERALKLATEARLSSLESRIHPHFLFNTLNSISSLIREDPPEAERLVERMAALLRFSLDSSHRSAVPLSREIKIVRDYLEIERIRFGPRLHYEIDVPAELDDLEIPPFSVQTLVENSVKYAVAPRREGGSVFVAAAERDGRLHLEVRDDGPGFNEHAIHPGHGLDILRSRLQTLFDGDTKLDFERRSGGMAVLMYLPARRAAGATA